jgi:hypothetical protein
VNTLTEQQKNLAKCLWGVVDFCIEHRGKNCLQSDREKIFRYVACCYFTGRLCASWEQGKIIAVVFYWHDFRERIESKYAEGRNQFEWKPMPAGDALFVGEVLGNRKAVAQMYQAAIEKYPNLITVPIYTMRRGKLIQIYGKQLERFMFRKERI